MGDDDSQRWEVPVLSAALLQPRTLTFRVAIGRVVLSPPQDDVVVPDAQIDVLCAAAHAALSAALRQRGFTNH
jgi:hypothetical protein